MSATVVRLLYTRRLTLLNNATIVFFDNLKNCKITILAYIHQITLPEKT
jgi:hypothetical protein